jgi:hypothetical protein
MVFYIIMTYKNKATTTLTAIVVIVSLMVGASVVAALISEGMGIQQASAPRQRAHFCSEHSPQPGTPPPCGPPARRAQ